MIDRRWDRIAANSDPRNKAAIGFVERLNHTIHVIQRQAYGLHDEEYLDRKALTCMLLEL